MLCDRCKKNEATITLTKVVNGESVVYNLCSDCAQDSEFGVFLEPEFLNQLLSDFFAMNHGLGAGLSEKDNPYSKVICPTCHTSYSEFVKNSRFGCPDCYDTFGVLMMNSIHDLQGSSSHSGKTPKFGYIPKEKTVRADENGAEVTNSAEEEQKAAASETVKAEDDSVKREETKIPKEKMLAILQSKLKEAIESEEYEDAAKYRDEIKKLKEGSEDE